MVDNEVLEPSGSEGFFFFAAEIVSLRRPRDDASRRAKGCPMNFENPKWCPKCSLRIAPYESRTVYQGVDYHQNCFLKLVHEQAHEERSGRPSFRGAKTETDQFVRGR